MKVSFEDPVKVSCFQAKAHLVFDKIAKNQERASAFLSALKFVRRGRNRARSSLLHSKCFAYFDESGISKEGTHSSIFVYVDEFETREELTYSSVNFSLFSRT